MIKEVFGDYPYLYLEDGYKEQVLLRDESGNPLFCMLEHKKGDCSILEFSASKEYKNFEFRFKHKQENSFSVSQIVGYTADAIVLLFSQYSELLEIIQTFEDRVF